ncbi:MAG: 16S rRNA (cytidine(1402)-2'-O)-methyltransferase, partial [Microcystaceae cyanobacterium]
PIGNLEDITYRAVSILQSVDAIAAEDTRHTGKLLQHLQINKPQISYHHHNRLSRQETLINELKQGKNIALVSDAGMPTLSDPGYDLVKACYAENISVVPIPGVTALTTAIAISGLDCDRFVFEGFLPPKGKKRKERLSLLGEERRTMVFYEAPHRIVSTLKDFCQVFGPDRPISIARELTKVYETIWRGRLEDAIAFYDNHPPKGEFTLVVAGQEESSILLSEEEVKKELKQLLSQGISRSQASRQLAQFTSLSRRQVYELSLEITP